MRSFSLRLAGCILAGFVVLGLAPSMAQQFRVNVHGPSSHFGSPDATDNGWTFGGGGEVLWEKRDWRYGVMGGGYHNSVWNLSLYLGVTGSYQLFDWVGVGLGVSAATGYDGDVCYEMDNGNTSCYQLEWARAVTIMPLPFVSIGKRTQLRIGGVTNLDSGLMHVMISVPLHTRR